MKTIFDEPTVRIVFDPVKFAKTAARLASEKASRLEKENLVLKAVIVVLLAAVAVLI